MLRSLLERLGRYEWVFFRRVEEGKLIFGEGNVCIVFEIVVGY